MPYAAEGILSTLSRPRLEGFHQVYQIPESVSLRVPTIDEWACFCLPGEVVIFEQTLKAGLQFSIPLFIHQLLTYIRLAPDQIMPNSWRILIAYIVLWPACSGGQDHITIPEFLYCYKAAEMHSGWWYFTVRVPNRALITGLPMSNRGWKNKFFFVLGNGLESLPWEPPHDRIQTIPKIWGEPRARGNS